MNSLYDVVILGAGHNGLVAAAYLARAGLSVLVLERNETLGGATASKKIFPDYDASLSRYAYLVSLLPDKIVRDLGLELELCRRSIASFTPYAHGDAHDGLLLSNVDENIGRRSMRCLTGSEDEFEQWQKFYRLTRVLAEGIWDSYLQPLRARADFAKAFTADAERRAAWQGFIEEPLGRVIERHLQHDLVRGVAFTDAKIGLLTHPHDPSLLQNRCFLLHVVGNKTGEWKVPRGGMGRVAAQLETVARRHGVEFQTSVRINALDLRVRGQEIDLEIDGQRQRVESQFLLINFGRDALARLTGGSSPHQLEDEGSVFKINMLLRRLPRLRAHGVDAATAFAGTFHFNEGYEQMVQSHRQAAGGAVPPLPPGEIYCHTLTDPTILGPALRADGYHTLTVFGLDAPWRLFQENPEAIKAEFTRRYLAGINAWLAEPLEDCLARAQDGSVCLEAKSPVDLESELGHPLGNIFHRAPQWPFAESADEVGTWGVETDFNNVFYCGSSARRGGAVSGIPGHNAAMKVLACLAP